MVGETSNKEKTPVKPQTSTNIPYTLLHHSHIFPAFFRYKNFLQKTHICLEKFDNIIFVVQLVQCMRRMIEERSLDQGYNGVKYLLTVIAVCLRIAYSFEGKNTKNPTSHLKVLAGSSSVLAAVFCTYWDFVHDWGLLNKTSKNRWLRDKLLIPQKKVYFTAMVRPI